MGKINDGNVVPQYHMTFMASFKYKNEHLCAVSLITYRHGLTVAHCLESFFLDESIPDFSEYALAVNCHNLSQGTNYPIEQVESSTKFDTKKKISDHDIACVTVNHNHIIIFLYENQ